MRSVVTHSEAGMTWIGEACLTMRFPFSLEEDYGLPIVQRMGSEENHPST